MNYVVVREVRHRLECLRSRPSRSGHNRSHQGKAKDLIREAIEFHLEGLREDKLPIPEPAASAEVVTVS
jgi:hypothetical protein